MPTSQKPKSPDHPCFHFREINSRSKIDFLSRQLFHRLVDHKYHLNLVVQVCSPPSHILRFKKNNFSKIIDSFKKKLSNFRKEREVKIQRFSVHSLKSWKYLKAKSLQIDKQIQTITQLKESAHLKPTPLSDRLDLLSRFQNQNTRSYIDIAPKNIGENLNFNNCNDRSSTRTENRKLAQNQRQSYQIKALFSREFPMKQYWESSIARRNKLDISRRSELIPSRSLLKSSSYLLPQPKSSYKKSNALEDTDILSKPSLCDTNSTKNHARSDRFRLRTIRIPEVDHRIFKLKDILTPSSDAGQNSRINFEGCRFKKRLVIPKYSSLDKKKQRKIRDLLGKYVQQSQISLVKSRKFSQCPASSS